MDIGNQLKNVAFGGLSDNRSRDRWEKRTKVLLLHRKDIRLGPPSTQDHELPLRPKGRGQKTEASFPRGNESFLSH